MALAAWLPDLVWGVQIGSVIFSCDTVHPLRNYFLAFGFRVSDGRSFLCCHVKSCDFLVV